MALPVHQVMVHEPLGERSFALAELPLSIGGPGAHLLLPEVSAGEVVAFGQQVLEDGQMGLQGLATGAQHPGLGQTPCDQLTA